MLFHQRRLRADKAPVAGYDTSKSDCRQFLSYREICLRPRSAYLKKVTVLVNFDLWIHKSRSSEPIVFALPTSSAARPGRASMTVRSASSSDMPSISFSVIPWESRTCLSASHLRTKCPLVSGSRWHKIQFLCIDCFALSPAALRSKSSILSFVSNCLPPKSSLRYPRNLSVRERA